MEFDGFSHLKMATGDIDATISVWRDLCDMRPVGWLSKGCFRHYFFENGFIRY